MNNFFTELNFRLSDTEIDIIRNLLIRYDDDLRRPSNTFALAHRIGKVDCTQLDVHPFFAWLRKTYNYGADFLAYDPDTFYRWHTDTADRLSVVNIIVYDYTERTTFIKENTGKGFELVSSSGTVYSIPYRCGYPMLINSQKPHCMINLEQKIRYVMSLSIDRPYPQVWKEFVDAGYIT